MSGFASEPERSHEEQLAHVPTHHAESCDKENERMSMASSESTQAGVDGAGGVPADTEITATQKMISAVSGSLLTSLLVTPLDVVRVRLQSQTHPKAYTLPSRGAASFANLPTNLGVTACCREVFWVTNTSPFCVAGSPASSSTATFTAINPSTSSSTPSATSAAMDTATADCAAEATRQKNFTSTFDALQKIARNEGALSLWRGLSPTLVMAIPGNVIYFTGYDALRSNPRSPIRKHVPENYAPLVAGSVARVAAAIVVSPVEMFRTRMQAATTDGKGQKVFMDTLRGMGQLAQTQGYSNLWRGLTLTMWRDVPFSGIYWWGYETMRNFLTSARDQRAGVQGQSRNRAPHFLDSFVAGATSGAVASIVTTPFDVGKTRRQVLEGESSRAPLSSSPGSLGKSALRPEEMTMPRFLYHIWLDEGVPGLFRGWAARCLKVAPACAIMISSYEVGKKMAQRMNERKKDDVGK